MRSFGVPLAETVHSNEEKMKCVITKMAITIVFAIVVNSAFTFRLEFLLD